MKKSILAAVALATTVFSTTGAHAATLVVDGGWKNFYFGGVGSSITDAVTGDLTYDFTLASSAELHVTDAYIIGDIFEISNFGSVLGSTGAFDLSGPTTSDAATAFAGSTYSKLSILLGPGSYSLTGKATASPFGSGGAFIELASARTGAVPEPATWAMMIGGFGMVGGTMRYRRRKTTVSFA